MNDYNFGNFVCTLREGKGLTQADIAQQLGVTPAAVSKWENGSSKPRVEILFKLAEILGVKPEELMAGRHISEESLDSETVQRINERYEYLTKVELHDTPNVKIRRIVAWIIDWNIIGVVAIILTSLVMSFLLDDNFKLTSSDVLIVLAAMLSYPICFVLRDVIFKGRSLGKRIMKLVVIDRRTGENAKVLQRILRNVFLFLMQFDFIVLLVSGYSIGDRVAHTVVLPLNAVKNNIVKNPMDKINGYLIDTALHKRKIIKRVIIVVGVLIVTLAIVFGIVLSVFSAQKDTVEYKLAYNYLINSDTFKQMNVAESKINFKRYHSTSRTAEDGSIVKTVRFGFQVQGRSFDVVGHTEDGRWSVCEECTAFK